MSSASIPGGPDYSDYWRSEAIRAKELLFTATSQGGGRKGRQFDFRVPAWALVTEFIGESKDRLVDGRRPTLLFGDANWWNRVKDLYSPLLLSNPALKVEIDRAAETPADREISSQGWGAIAELVAKRAMPREIFTQVAIQQPLPRLSPGEPVEYQAFADVYRHAQGTTTSQDLIGSIVGGAIPVGGSMPFAPPANATPGSTGGSDTRLLTTDPNVSYPGGPCPAGMERDGVGPCVAQVVTARPVDTGAVGGTVVASSAFGGMPVWGWVVLGAAGVVTAGAIVYAVTRPKVPEVLPADGLPPTE